MWWAGTGSAGPHLQPLLDDVESQRWLRFRRQADADRMLVGVALAKTVLAAILGIAPADVAFDRACARCGQPHGKPRLAAPPGAADTLHFSVSHSGERICVAISDRAPVGVDVEALSARTDLERTAGAVLNEQELRDWAALPHDQRGPALIRAWTRKEALLKATGHGLALAPDRLGIVDRAGHPVLAEWPDEVPRPAAVLHDLDPGPGYLACLAVLEEGPLAVRELDATGLLHRPDIPGGDASAGAR